MVFVTLDVHQSFDAGLVDELAAIFAGRHREVERGVLAVGGAAGEFQNSIGLGVQDVPFGGAVFIFTHIFKPTGRTVVAIGNNHPLLDDKRAHLPTFAVGKLGPFARHPQVGDVVFALFFDRAKMGRKWRKVVFLEKLQLWI